MNRPLQSKAAAKAVAVSRQQVDARARLTTLAFGTLLLSLLLLGAGRLVGP